MNVPIPAEFERFARERVAAGAVASEAEAVAIVLREYLHRIEELRALIDPGIASLDRGEGADGPAFMLQLMAEQKSRMAG